MLTCFTLTCPTLPFTTSHKRKQLFYKIFQNNLNIYWTVFVKLNKTVLGCVLGTENALTLLAKI